jgi:hypothetical protein
MQFHLDVGVVDVAAAVDEALAIGATVADHQPQEDVRIMLDPHGHPFCLYKDTSHSARDGSQADRAEHVQ